MIKTYPKVAGPKVAGKVRNLVAASVALALIGLPASGFAAVIHQFDFTTPGTVITGSGSQPLTVTSDNGLDGYLSAFNSAGNPTSLVQNADGVGVGNIIQVDEKLRFSIAPNSAGVIETIVWEQGAIFADFLELYVDGIFATSFTTSNPGGLDTIDLSGLGLSGSVFDFVGIDADQSGSTAYKISSLTLSVDDGGPGPGQIPAPATLGVIGVGLMGLGMAMRRRRQTA